MGERTAANESRVTYKDMCESIATFLNARNPERPPISGEDVWNISPTGELWPVHELYDICVSAGMRHIAHS